jgi:hypothetical protein
MSASDQIQLSTRGQPSDWPGSMISIGFFGMKF